MVESRRGDVALWRVDLGVAADDLEDLARTLDEAEQERADRFLRHDDRLRFTVTRAALRIELGKVLGVHPSDLRFEVTSTARPFLRWPRSTDLDFNVSHADRLALVALRRRGGMVGVDVEAIREDFPWEDVADLVLAPPEQRYLASLPAAERLDAFFMCWVHKEAYLKATGEGLGGQLTTIDTSPGAVLPGDTWARSVDVGAGYAAAVVGTAPCARIVMGDWSARHSRAS